jgi:hypothetical protein
MKGMEGIRRKIGEYLFKQNTTRFGRGVPGNIVASM